MGREGEIKCRYRRLRHAISASSMPNAPHGCSHFRSEWMLKGVDVSKVWSWKSKVRVLRRAWRKAVSQSETSSQTSATLGCISSSTTPVALFDIAGSDAILSIHSQVERVLSCCGTHRLVSVLLESRRRR